MPGCPFYESLNTQLKPIERHAVLYFIEQGLMPKNGKRFEWEVGIASGNPLVHSGGFENPYGIGVSAHVLLPLPLGPLSRC